MKEEANPVVMTTATNICDWEAGFSHVLLSWVCVQRTMRLLVKPSNCSIERLSIVPIISRAISTPLPLSIIDGEKRQQ